MSGLWSRAEIDLMRRLWNEDGWTAEQIASAIGRQLGIFRTRAAVLGRINRMPGVFVCRGKSGGAKDSMQARRMSATSAHVRKARLPSPVSQAPFVAWTPAVGPVRTTAEMIAGIGAGISRDSNGKPVLAKPLVDLASRECRFPVAGDDPADVLFCADAVHPDEWRPGKVGGCYCVRHREIAGAGFSSPGTFVDRRSRAA